MPWASMGGGYGMGDAGKGPTGPAACRKKVVASATATNTPPKPVNAPGSGTMRGVSVENFRRSRGFSFTLSEVRDALGQREGSEHPLHRFRMRIGVETPKVT